ncbi:MAG: hypothetical protein RRY16_00235, partial [Bacilli bacterium]
MKKIKKIYIMTLFTLVISVFNITIINAEVKPGKGFKLYYTDLLGSQVGDVKYVLKASDAGFPYASIILSGLPSFTSSNAISVANQYFANDTNLKNLISSIGLLPYDTAKLKNYTLNIQGIYGSSKNEYRYTYTTTVSSSYEIVCNRGACAKKRENGICTSGYNYSCSDGRNRVYRSADKQITDTVGSSSTTNTTTAWGVPKPILKDNQKLIKTEEQTVSDYSYKSITSLVFDRTNIEQAELCG